ncbi:MAG: hypothetical protein HKN76_06495 [Saprospiraceae bacterium]|nr:hypothetical protein [Saprospiraceae bacterium]
MEDLLLTTASDIGTVLESPSIGDSANEANSQISDYQATEIENSVLLSSKKQSLYFFF